MMSRFESFAEAVTYVQEHGSVGYKAPMSAEPGILPAVVTDDGRIKITFHIPEDEEWPEETYHRFASSGPDDATNHFDRLRKP